MLERRDDALALRRGNLTAADASVHAAQRGKSIGKAAGQQGRQNCGQMPARRGGKLTAQARVQLLLRQAGLEVELRVCLSVFGKMRGQLQRQRSRNAEMGKEHFAKLRVKRFAAGAPRQPDVF